MSSSGLIYAAIVLAWAVYLVPVWLRREDELNRARQVRRYATAIKVLAHKEAFERRASAAAVVEEPTVAVLDLPLAAGQSAPLPYPAARTGADSPGSRVAAPRTLRAWTPPPASASLISTPSPTSTFSPIRTSAAASTPTPAPASPSVSTPAPTPLSTPAAASAPTPATTSTPAGPTSTSTAPATSTTPPAPTTSARTGLIARRRRMVTLLFAASTLGAAISADLGPGFLWLMAVPAALLSGYIFWVRKEERLRALDRARRQAARAEQTRQARLRAQDAEAARKAAADADAAAQSAAAAEEADRLTEDQHRLQEAARRRAAAAARSRAQSQRPPVRPAAAADTPLPHRRAANE